MGVSCHNEKELKHAVELDADYVSLSPVKLTQSHIENIACLGWQEFQKLSENTSLPVFALGGLKENDLEQAKSMGAFGIAAISAWW